LLKYYRDGYLHESNYVIDYICETINVPAVFDKEIITNPFIIETFIEKRLYILGRNQDSQSLFNMLDEAKSLRKHFHKQVIIRKCLSENAVYPKNEYSCEKACYFFNFNTPIIVLRDIEEGKPNFRSQGNELAWITSTELRLISALSFSSIDSYCVFNIEDDFYTLPEEFVLYNEKGFSKTVLDRIVKLIFLLEKIYNKDTLGKDYSFRKSCINEYRVNKFFDSLNINDDLELRICFLFLKAGMLYKQKGNFFGEEAILNMLVGLEGCLYLISKKHLKLHEFNYQLTLAYLENAFPNEGYEIILEELREYRNMLAHPDSRYECNWSLVFFSDDFIHNYNWLLKLLYFCITKEK